MFYAALCIAVPLFIGWMNGKDQVDPNKYPGWYK